MENPQGHTKRQSREEFMELYQHKGCQKCGATESSAGQRLLVCGGCEGPNYCSKECQRADWPDHKSACKRHQANRAEMQAYGFAETAQQFDDWTKHRKMPIVMMMCGMLGKRARTHVLRITVDHQPRSSPPFKAVAYRIVPIAELQPQMAETVRTNLQQPTPQDAQAKGEWGCAVIDCPAIMYSVIHTGPVFDDVNKLYTPQHIPMCLELLNMDAHEALAVATNIATG